MRPFAGLTVDGQRHGRRAATPAAACARRARHAARGARAARPFDKRDQLAASLTLPDRKRLEVARALATEPKLLLLDEVMAGLRPTETDRMVAILQRAQRESGPDHPADRARHARGDGARARVLVLHHGAVIAEGTPDEVVRDPAVIESYLGAEAV